MRLQLTQCKTDLPSDTLPEFTAKCTAAIGIEVPAFNCDEGTLVPENNLTGDYPDQLCDAPNVLNAVCDPNSRYQVLVQTNEVAIVAHCRKQNLADGFYGDIAVIQYNRINGATCFYQALGNLPAQTTAPIEGNDPAQDKFPWKDPEETAAINCVSCHDNGPFVRSPYLAQLRDEPKNRLPGTNEGTGPWDQRFNWNNKDLPYKFVGNDFQSWKVYSVSVTGTGSGCISCHRLGISSTKDGFSARGTAHTLGLTATTTYQLHKNVHSDTAPIWMKPGQNTFDATAYNQALGVAICASSLVKRGNKNLDELFFPDGCQAVEYGQGDTCTNVPDQ